MARQQAGEGLEIVSWGCVVVAGEAAARGEERDNALKMGEVAASWTPWIAEEQWQISNLNLKL